MRFEHRHRNLIHNYPPLWSAVVFASGLLSVARPTIAAEALVIRNQAIASYENPSGSRSSEEMSTISNILELGVLEVAGIGINSVGVTDEGGTAPNTIASNDTIYFRFDIRNIGNDSTKIFIPNRAAITGAATFQKVQYLDGNTWKDIPQQGWTSSQIAAGGIFPVRVMVKVNELAKGDITVSLGKTATPDRQNQERNNPGDLEDIYSIDDADNANPQEVSGAPVNGTREAMTTQTATIGSQFQAFARIQNTSDGYVATDNSVTYNLSLEVLETTPPGRNIEVATDLVGTNINLNGSVRTGILVSEAIPLNTRFVSAAVPTNGNWIVVYQYGNPIGVNDRADTATWSTQAPTNTAIVRRVGFLLPDERLAKGTTVSGFQMKVSISNPLIISEVYAIAQVFGTTPANPSDPNDRNINLNRPVFDESGDNNPNNWSSDGQPGPKDANGKPLVTPGIIDPNTSTEDPRNPNRVGKDDNGGTAENGEYTTTEISVSREKTIFNGPKDAPTATGTKGDDDDFTSQTTSVPWGIRKGVLFDPGMVEILNTVQNAANFQTDIKVIPQLLPGENLPDSTKVRLKKDMNDRGVSFTLKEGKFVPDDGTKPALVLVDVASKTDRDYITEIDLPPETEAIKGYSVVLLAFFDLNNNDRVDSNEPQNNTIDIVYSGFIDFLKESRILDSKRKPITGENGEFSSTAKTALKDQYIEYRIKFKNISQSKPENSTSKGISATKFEIVEDGNATPNNWGAITENVPASTQVSPGTVEFSPVNDPHNLTVNKYTHKVGTLAPQEEGLFRFIRKVR